MDLSTPVIVVTYAEIALKGKNRPLFQRRLVNNLRAAVRGESAGRIEHVESRFLVWLDDPARAPQVGEKLARVFGVQWVSPAIPVVRSQPEDDLVRVEGLAAELARRHAGEARNFRVDSRRSDRDFPVPSPEINQRVGKAVGDALGLPARMSAPDFTVNVLVLQRHILVFGEKIAGHGGLPLGASGRVMCLLSGGIDSPVAAWLMMRRGCRPEFVHFYSGRSYAEADADKIEELVRILARYAPQPLKLHLVPVVPYELRAIGTVPESHDMVMFRRFMMRTAARLAWRQNCQALVTGDSLGQVASQTIHNIAAIAPDVELPIFRPLVGLDKTEITARSERIGAFQVSIQPYRDCCSIRSPRPVLDARARDLLRQSAAMDLEAAVDESLLASERLTIGPEGRVVPSDAPTTTVARADPAAADEPEPGPPETAN
ncbi:MAG: tRNA uracil 4-sulfurtransferase ThiI [Candidatus Krumholzibacteriia bacterium]